MTVPPFAGGAVLLPPPGRTRRPARTSSLLRSDHFSLLSEPQEHRTIGNARQRLHRHGCNLPVRHGDWYGAQPRLRDLTHLLERGPRVDPPDDQPELREWLRRTSRLAKPSTTQAPELQLEQPPARHRGAAKSTRPTNGYSSNAPCRPFKQADNPTATSMSRLTESAESVIAARRSARSAAANAAPSNVVQRLADHLESDLLITEPIPIWLGLVELQYVDGLGEFPARQGQQRSLRRILHVLSCAFARLPGARSFAWAWLASFCGSGLFLPLYGTFAQVLPW